MAALNNCVAKNKTLCSSLVLLKKTCSWSEAALHCWRLNINNNTAEHSASSSLCHSHTGITRCCQINSLTVWPAPPGAFWRDMGKSHTVSKLSLIINRYKYAVANVASSHTVRENKSCREIKILMSRAASTIVYYRIVALWTRMKLWDTTTTPTSYCSCESWHIAALPPPDWTHQKLVAFLM